MPVPKFRDWPNESQLNIAVFIKDIKEKKWGIFFIIFVYILSKYVCVHVRGKSYILGIVHCQNQKSNDERRSELFKLTYNWHETKFQLNFSFQEHATKENLDNGDECLRILPTTSMSYATHMNRRLHETVMWGNNGVWHTGLY